MRRLALIIWGILLVHYSIAQSFRLAPPLLKYESLFFAGSMELQILFDQPGTSVHYTLNGEEPTEKSFTYKKPLVIKGKITTVKVKSFADIGLTPSSDQYQPSQSAEATFIKEGYKIKEISGAEPDKKYYSNGLISLSDNKGGSASASSPTWLGFQNDTVNIVLSLQGRNKINEVFLNFLQDENGWIFLPEKVLISSYNEKIKMYVPFGEEVWLHEKFSPGNQCIYKIIKAQKKPVASDKILIKIITLKKIPEWHAGKGNHAWVFIDEIKVY